MMPAMRRGAEHVALLGVAGEDERRASRAASPRGPRRPRRARSSALSPNVDHAGLAAAAEMGELPCAARRLHSAARGRRRRSRASSARVAAATSAWRIRLSPTRKVAMPTRREARESAGVKMPLSPTTMRSRGTSGGEALADRERGLEGVQVAVVDADQARARGAARARARPRRAPRRARPCRARAPCPRAPRRSRRRPPP